MEEKVQSGAQPGELSVIDQLKKDVQFSKRKREDFIDGWQLNIDERRGKVSSTTSDEDRTMVPMDWTITKAKVAQLFSQMPEARLVSRNEEFAEAVPVYTKLINALLAESGVEAVMNEMVHDCVNAAGVGAAIVRYESLEEQTQVPALDMATLPPELQAAAMQGTFKVPMMPTKRPTDVRFCVSRISPADLLWPTRFRLSDWDKSPWLGHTGRNTWPEAKRMFGLDDSVKDKVVGAAAKKDKELVREAGDKKTDDDMVEYDEVFYWRYLYHEDEKYFDAIQRVVFVTGLDQPVINEPWQGQEFDEENGGYVGSCLLPVRVLTLAYVSDEAIPPSDSAIIRPLVKELQLSRQHMRDQRRHSLPLRWFDVDRVDPTMSGDLINGTWNGMIPTIGAGDKVIGEVSRSSYPRENLEFDRIIEAQIQKAVSVGPNQQSNYSETERSASEANIVQANFQTEIGQQRARVAACFVGIAEVLAGLFALFGDIQPTKLGALIGPKAAQRLGAWDRTTINHKFVFDVRADTMVRLDAQQLVKQLASVLNITAQSGFINPKPLIRRIMELNGLDPAEVMIDPQPKGPEPPKINYTFKGEDLLNPLVVALIVHSGQAPTPQEMEAAKMLGMASAAPVPMNEGTPGPMGVSAAPGAPAGGPPAGPVSDPEIPDKAFPGWESAPRVNTRRAEG